MTSSKRSLTTVELAEAAVLADISVLLVVAGWFLPATGLFWAVSVVPFATLMVRHRPRTVVVGMLSGCAIGFLALGAGLAIQIGVAGFTGFVIGTSIKRNWGPIRTVALALATTWTTASAFGVAFLAVFSTARLLAFKQIRLQWIGTKNFNFGTLRVVDLIVKLAHSRTWLVVGVVEFFPVMEGALIARTNRRIWLLVRLGLLVAYTSLVSVVNVWAGAIALASAAIGFLVARRRRGRRLAPRVWLACAGVTAGLLALGGRAPLLRSVDSQWPWVRAHLHSLFTVIAHIGDRLVPLYLDYWYVTFPATLIGPVAVVTLLARGIARPIIRRLERALRRPLPVRPQPVGPAGPVPVTLENVSFSYPDAPTPALDEISLDIDAGTFVGVLGDNGSGKSTLARILAGAAPASGSVQRPGSAAPGARGGTAVIFQRPESQVLGVRVREDVVWGLDDEASVDVDAILDVVGLGGFATRETSTLSGGELQRLAIAAALAREPKLLVSDESTAMVDPEGRQQIVALFSSLATRGITVVHITHRLEEVREASKVFVLNRGRVETVMRP